MTYLLMPDIDSEQQFIANERMARQMTGSQPSEVVIYYRRPRTGPMAGWIIWGDSQQGKRSDYIIRGFMPLMHLGRVWDGADEQGEQFKRYGPWGAILCHPDGPKEFPVEQLIVSRWYSEEGLRYSCRGQLPRGRKPAQLFPQLVAHTQEHPIHEYACPECNGRTFLQPVHLARHLRNQHDYERLASLPDMALCHVDSPTLRMRPFYMPFCYEFNGERIYLSEDYAFCQRAIEAGFTIYANPAVRLGHLGQYVYRLENMLQPEPDEQWLRLTRNSSGVAYRVESLEAPAAGAASRADPGEE